MRKLPYFGAAILALSLGLVSTNTGMELTASHSDKASSSANIEQVVQASKNIGSERAAASAIRPTLVCDPGVTCASPSYAWPGEECDNPGDIALDPYGQPLECQYVGADEYGNPIFIWVEV
ncbi:hypothetical protein [Ferrimicrobium acidiphilum]|uniref:hypothetical protein n=1 Tax=Ferrimicrobium acidiphilum TaxID=121039 RepID=UPI0023F53F54|nr:hypothetical protein [Ferrimicrobium acidiphilum]